MLFTTNTVRIINLNIGETGQQIKNCYADLEKILNYCVCTFNDVIVENIFTTNMSLFFENSAYRISIYTKHSPTSSWIGVNELANRR